MSTTINNIKRVFNNVKVDLMRKAKVYHSNLDLFNVKLLINDGTPDYIARAWCGEDVLEVTPSYFMGVEDEVIEEIILHEFFHLIAYEVCDRDYTHGKNYKDLIELYGYNRNIGRTYGLVTLDGGSLEKPREYYKYTCTCAKCGKFLYTAYRKSSITYKSLCCDAKIKFKDNWVKGKPVFNK